MFGRFEAAPRDGARRWLPTPQGCRRKGPCKLEGGRQQFDHPAQTFRRLAMWRFASKDRFGTIDGPTGRERSLASCGAPPCGRRTLVDVKVLQERHRGVSVCTGRIAATAARALLLRPLRQLQGHSSPNTPQKLAFKRALLATRMVGHRFGSVKRHGSNENKDAVDPPSTGPIGWRRRPILSMSTYVLRTTPHGACRRLGDLRFVAVGPGGFAGLSVVVCTQAVL